MSPSASMLLSVTLGWKIKNLCQSNLLDHGVAATFHSKSYFNRVDGIFPWIFCKKPKSRGEVLQSYAGGRSTVAARQCRH
mmetsp:Transcript_29518/g.68073  ORF Transcript_29518/g.68073 Transcript_29518/m.68073 type:complete len:80 (+) Transcript_29518:268-507(+)